MILLDLVVVLHVSTTVTIVRFCMVSFESCVNWFSTLVWIAGLLVTHYLQSITPSIALGAELVYQYGPSVPGGEIALLSAAARYTGKMVWILFIFHSLDWNLTFYSWIHNSAMHAAHMAFSLCSYTIILLKYNGERLH